jgi:hypothetical protein
LLPRTEVWRFVRRRAYASFGLRSARLSACLAEAPAVLWRWWCICGGADIRRADHPCAPRGTDPLCRADGSWTCCCRKTPPGTGRAEACADRLPEALDYDAAARTLALADPRWNSQPALYAALRLSREPYLPAQLAVTSAELTAAHIRGGRQAWVLRGLLDAVIAAPQINFPEALLALAKTLAGQA